MDKLDLSLLYVVVSVCKMFFINSFGELSRKGVSCLHRI
jgi:hypothetical protein